MKVEFPAKISVDMDVSTNIYLMTIQYLDDLRRDYLDEYEAGEVKELPIMARQNIFSASVATFRDNLRMALRLED